MKKIIHEKMKERSTCNWTYKKKIKLKWALIKILLKQMSYSLSKLLQLSTKVRSLLEMWCFSLRMETGKCVPKRWTSGWKSLRSRTWNGVRQAILAILQLLKQQQAQRKQKYSKKNVCVCVTMKKGCQTNGKHDKRHRRYTSSKQQQAQCKENYNKSKRPVSSVDHCHP